MGKKKKILADFDIEYLNEVLNTAERRGIWRRFFDDYVVIGKEHLEDMRANRDSFVGFGNHVSHFDYIFIGKVFKEMDALKDFPRITAGTNLRNIVAAKICTDFDRCNVLWTDRAKISKGDRQYIREWKKAVKDSIYHLENVFAFPDAGRNWGDEVLSRGLNTMGKIVINSPMNPLVVPFAFDYDNPIEGKYQDKIAKHRGKSGLGRGLYYYYDINAFLGRASQKNKGRAYMWIGKPERVREIVGEGNPKKKAERLDDHVRRGIIRGLEEIAAQKIAKN